MKTKKRILSILLAVCMIAALGVPAMAATVTSVTITGTPEVGTQLTLTYDDTPTGTVTYEWSKADDGMGASAAVITGAEDATYTPVVGDVGSFIKVEVTLDGTTDDTDTYGDPGPVVSAWVGPVTAAAGPGPADPESTAAPEGSGSIDVDADLKEGFVKVLVPTSNGAAFAIDPLELGGTDTQIHSEPIKFVNKSDVDVSIDLSFKATGKGTGGPTIVTSPDAIGKDSEGKDSKAKQVYIYATPAKTFTVDSVDSTLLNSTTPPVYGKNEVVIGSAAGTADAPAASMTFALKAAAYSTAPGTNTDDTNFTKTAEEAGLAVYRLKGLVNQDTTTAYVTGDVTLETTYKIKGISKSAYDTSIATPNVEAKNLVDFVSVGGGGGGAFAIIPGATSVPVSGTATYTFTGLAEAEKNTKPATIVAIDASDSTKTTDVSAMAAITMSNGTLSVSPVGMNYIKNTLKYNSFILDVTFTTSGNAKSAAVTIS